MFLWDWKQLLLKQSFATWLYLAILRNFSKAQIPPEHRVVDTFLFFRITPYEWDNPHPCKSEPDELETQFTLSNSLWFGIGSILCQGSDILPK